MVRIRSLYHPVLAAWAVALACAPSGRGGWTPTDEDAAVYSVVLDSLYPAEPSGRLPVVAQALTPVPGSKFRDRLVYLTAEDALGPDTAMITRLAAAEPRPRSPREVLAGRAALQWLDSSLVGARPPARPGTPFVIRSGVWLSRVVYSADGERALLYEALECGGMCGHGRIVMLRRQPAGKWAIVKVLTDYVS